MCYTSQKSSQKSSLNFEIILEVIFKKIEKKWFFSYTRNFLVFVIRG